MAEGRAMAEWGRMASLLALIANVNRDPKKRSKPFKPAEFLPADLPGSTAAAGGSGGMPIRAANITDLKALLGRRPVSETA